MIIFNYIVNFFFKISFFLKSKCLINLQRVFFSLEKKDLSSLVCLKFDKLEIPICLLPSMCTSCNLFCSQIRIDITWDLLSKYADQFYNITAFSCMWMHGFVVVVVEMLVVLVWFW